MARGAPMAGAPTVAVHPTTVVAGPARVRAAAVAAPAGAARPARPRAHTAGARRAVAVARCARPRHRRCDTPSRSRIRGSNCDARERNWRASSACSGLSPDSCSDDAHQAREGGIVGGGGSFGPRSLITTVPAKTSPMRLPFGDNMLQITAGPPEEHPDLHHRRPARETGPGGSVPGRRHRRPPAARAPSCPATCPASRSRTPRG